MDYDSRLLLNSNFFHSTEGYHSMRKFSIGICFLACTLLLLPQEVARAKEKTSPPNIIIMMADDMGFSDIGCYGGEIKTPNLNRLADGGLRFTQFYNTGRCCPTRASLLTGLYPHQAGIGHMMSDFGVPGYRGDLNRNCQTIAEVLKPAGYHTYMSGKWHVTKQVGHWTGEEEKQSKHNFPLQRGFDKFYGTIHGAGSFYDPATLSRGNRPIEPSGEDYFYTDAISREASRFIQQHTRQAEDEPFFLYVAYTSPHWPLHAMSEDIEKVKGRYDQGWDALRAERYQRMIEMGIVHPEWNLTERDKNVPTWEEVSSEEKAWFIRCMEVYAAQIEVMDRGIGKIVNTLKKNDLLENTLIFFLADNGGCAEVLKSNPNKSLPLHVPTKTRSGEAVSYGNDPSIMPGPATTYQSYGIGWANSSNTPFRLYKHYVHEGGISTPLIVHWPAGFSAKGELRSEPGHLIDLMATCVDVADADYPSEVKGKKITPLEGVSLAPAFEAQPLEREAIYFEHEGNRAVRQGKWKLVSRNPGPWELYDIKADRSETNNLVEEQPEKAKELEAMYEAWAKRAHVIPKSEWPRKNSNPKKNSNKKKTAMK
ncbi:Arylsulfatase (Aryl-sulfate sulfohydrolase) [Planctomycetales bacterium 10988]|nr:Arylsulfatase (Aryl-sulfate sulfohydrolase) [Planctomycetales bacterium 10988]